jgi:hypothetical protein
MLYGFISPTLALLSCYLPRWTPQSLQCKRKQLFYGRERREEQKAATLFMTKTGLGGKKSIKGMRKRNSS